MQNTEEWNENLNIDNPNMDSQNLAEIYEADSIMPKMGKSAYLQKKPMKKARPDPQPHTLFQKDAPWIRAYIATKCSYFTKNHVARALDLFYTYIRFQNPKIKSILEVDPLQFRTYFEMVDRKTMRKSVKTKTRQHLKAFIFWIISPDLARGILPKINYEMIFSNKFYMFRESSGPREEDPLTREDVFELLSFYRGRNFRDFVMFSLLAYTGMRVGGLSSIKIQNIDMQNRKIITQEKPTQVHSGLNEYCIPQKIMMDLESYILEIQDKNPMQEILFPVSTNSIRRQLHKWKAKTTHPHAFRDAINTRWQEMGMEESLRAILLNQQPSGINCKHYLKKYRSWTERVALYDQYFPY